jgi:Fic family protein
MAHPFTDGNGRFARIMAHAAMSQLCDLTMPTIALAPALYREGALLAASLHSLSDTGSWDSFSSIFCHIVANAIKITEEVIELENWPNEGASRAV